MERGRRLRNAREFAEVLEEGRLTPPRAELEHFYDAVQSMAMRVERAQSQVEKLLAKAAARERSQ